MNPSAPATSATPPSAKPPAVGRYRWSICGLLFFSVALNYIDRNIIGILKGPLSEELHWTENDYGNIAAAFQFAYAFGYLLGGRMMDRIGVRRGLPIAVAVWSAAAAAHGLCAHLPVGKSIALALSAAIAATVYPASSRMRSRSRATKISSSTIRAVLVIVHPGLA